MADPTIIHVFVVEWCDSGETACFPAATASAGMRAVVEYVLGVALQDDEDLFTKSAVEKAEELCENGRYGDAWTELGLSEISDEVNVVHYEESLETEEGV